ncbi:MAG: transcription elongation factor GreA [Candidatus Komeilibacteria bacterium RIFCSPLOWO2_01_FULL_52_15]|uniref:Transcription elongation factor GreA n=2 Tax=Candidatus Komeiliibacteriota TaxID=1817908 RepID=A0A1G2BQ84_9BACT|nr:MAG: transcription elongation factor GreA [Candidatus Komeilibacteria bacterium RIFCSPHIGHO2_01_FULL_52_14]OGY91268.1 MAG: transcription elongation factor GreA [Candidatus Komeilibacteria bacterium RIFCSPLOWO2_01_FULL_52_15]
MVMTLTPEGVAKLKLELEVLKKERRPEIVERIRHAKEYGDLSENAEYHDAKEEQAFIEGRIIEIENTLKTASIVTKKKTEHIDIGSSVVLLKDGTKHTFSIVGSTEADPAAGKISVDSPLGQALIGKAAGDSVNLQTPTGSALYRVVAVD